MTSEPSLPPAASLDHARTATLPRFGSSSSTPPASLAIHGAAAALFVAACACAILAPGLAGWAPGLVYVAYEIVLAALVLAAAPRVEAPALAPARRPTLAVVVAAHDEAEALPATLQALLAQSDAPDLIVVADDGSRDDTTGRLTRDFDVVPPLLGTMATSASHPALRWLRLPHGGKARALDAALLAVASDVVLTVDADTRLAPDAVAAFRAAFAANPNLVAAGATLVPSCAATRLGRWLQAMQRSEYARYTLAFTAWARRDALLHIPGAFAGYRRDALLAVGGFDPASLVEDYELIHRLRRHSARHGLGWTTGMVDAQAITDAPATLAAFLRQRRRWFCGFLATQFRYRDMVGAARYGSVGRFMLPIKAFDTLQPLHGLVALVLLPVLALQGRWSVLAIAAILFAGKAALDLRLQARAARPREPGAMAAALAGLLAFDTLRHIGAALGWVAFLTGDLAWPPRRTTAEDVDAT